MTQPTITKTHAKFSPSGMAANMACIGKIAMEDGLPNTSSKFADEGTCAHFLGAYCLELGANATDYDGSNAQYMQSIALWRNTDGTEGEGFAADMPAGSEIYHKELITEAFAAHVQTYVDHVRDYAQGHKILVEQKLSIEDITGEEGATGTADAVLLLPDEIVVIDLKFGIGNEVSAENNPQLMTYALAAYKEFVTRTEGGIEKVRLVISQPRISNAPNEWVCSIEDLLAFGAKVREHARSSFGILKEKRKGYAVHLVALTPNEVSCKYCKAKKNGSCEALSNAPQQIIGVQFEDLTQEIAEQQRNITSLDDLRVKMQAIPLIEMVMESWRAAADRELYASSNSPEVCEKLGFKLVQGKRGNQAWLSEAVGEKLVRRMVGAKNAYDKKLKSPTKVKEMLKGDDKKLQVVEKHIRQAEGKPSVAPISDKREALVLQDLSFDNLEDDLI